MKERDILKIYNNYCVIGMSPDPDKYSYQIYQCLKNAGKHVYGISPGSLTVVSIFSLTKSLKTLIISMLLSFFVVKFVKFNVGICRNV